MNYCQAGDKPTIKYQFSGQAARTYKSNFAPIEVITKPLPIESSENYNPEGFGVGFIPLNGNGTFYWYSVTDYKIFQIPAGVDQVWGTTPRIALKYCGSSFIKVPNCNSSPAFQYTQCLDTSFLNLNTLQFDPNRKCPANQQGGTRCSIQVLYNGQVIFQDQGNCPVTFDVTCGNCADDEIKCEKPEYPGYCCVKCSEIVTEIQSIKSTLRSINYG